MDLTHCII